MPTTRKSTRQAAGGKQSTLSFNHRVTKAVPKSIKDAVADNAKPPSKESIPAPAAAVKTPDEDVVLPTTDADEEEEETKVEETPKSEAELRAADVSASAIDRYWASIEASRTAKAVHKKHGEGLSTGEKVLRYFDVSSQYGPCVGITRLKRWQRAERLGLHPPIEVLAVLLGEEAKGTTGIERAHMDELLNSMAVGP